MKAKRYVHQQDLLEPVESLSSFQDSRRLHTGGNVRRSIGLDKTCHIASYMQKVFSSRLSVSGWPKVAIYFESIGRKSIS